MYEVKIKKRYKKKKEKNNVVLQRHKNKGNLCYLDEQVLKRNHNRKMKKKMKFSNVVEVLGDTLVGRRVSSLSN